MADEAQQETAATAAEQQTAAGQSTAGVVQEPSLEDRLAAAAKVNKDLERKLADTRKVADRLPVIEAELAKLQGKEAEFQAAQQREQIRAEERAKLVGGLVSASASTALLAAKVPPAFVKMLDLSDVTVDDDGRADEAAIAAKVADLIKNVPSVVQAEGPRFQGAAEQGARKEPPAKSLVDQIAEAEKAGDWNTAGRLKVQLLTEPH